MKRNRLNTVYCKSCRKKYVDVDCDSCGNRHKGLCDSCGHWKYLKDYYELSPYYVIKEKE